MCQSSTTCKHSSCLDVPHSHIHIVTLNGELLCFPIIRMVQRINKSQQSHLLSDSNSQHACAWLAPPALMVWLSCTSPRAVKVTAQNCHWIHHLPHILLRCSADSMSDVRRRHWTHNEAEDQGSGEVGLTSRMMRCHRMPCRVLALGPFLLPAFAARQSDPSVCVMPCHSEPAGSPLHMLRYEGGAFLCIFSDKRA